MKKYLLFSALALLPLTLFAEKSAFGAGDLNNPSPYGLTKAEKHILDNKENIEDIEGTIRRNRTRITDVEESLSGMKSIVEGLNETGRDDKLSLRSLKNELIAEKDINAQTNIKLDTLILHHDENIEQLKLVMSEISAIIDSINGNYVTKEEYNNLAQEINSFKLEISKELKKIAIAGNNSFDNKSSAAVSQEAKIKFEKKKYADAIDAYEHLIKKNYKPAAAHYYIGESYFQLNEYSNAIAYFKESAKRYSKGVYMPNLMLHTAISLNKTGDKDGAKQFFKAVIAKYPKSKEAKKAKGFLN